MYLLHRAKLWNFPVVINIWYCIPFMLLKNDFGTGALARNEQYPLGANKDVYVEFHLRRQEFRGIIKMTISSPYCLGNTKV